MPQTKDHPKHRRHGQYVTASNGYCRLIGKHEFKRFERFLSDEREKKERLQRFETHLKPYVIELQKTMEMIEALDTFGEMPESFDNLLDFLRGKNANQ